MDPEELARAAGEAPPPPPAPIPGATVVLRDGSLADFDSPETAQRFLAENPDAAVAIDTPELQRQRALAREYGGSPIIAGTLGALRGATVTGSSILAGALGLGEAEAAYREANPEAAIAGEIAGTAGSMLYGAGEAGIAGRGIAAAGRAITAPARAVMGAAEAAGALAGRRIAAAAGGGAAGPIIGRAAALGVEGAVESTAYEAGGIVSEQMLRDAPELTAERVVSRLGGAAAFGAGAGAGLGGLLAIGGEARRAAGAAATATSEHIARALCERLGRDAAPGVADLVADAYARSAAIATGRSADDVARFTALTPEGREARRIVQEGPDAVFRPGTEDVGAALRDITENLDPIFFEATGTRKIDDIQRAVRTDTVVDQERIARNAIEQTRRAIDEMTSMEGLVAYQSMGSAKKMRAAADVADLRLAAALDQEDAARRSAEIFGLVDDLKRQMGSAQRASQTGDAGSLIEDLYQTHMMRPLEDAQVWGDVATGIQRDTNRAWHRMLNWDRDATGVLMRPGRAVGFDRVRWDDSAKVNSYLQRVGTAANASDEQIVRDWISGVQELTATVGQHYTLPPGASDALRRVQGAVSRFRSVHDNVAQRAAVLNQWSDLNRSAGTGLGGILGGAAATSAVLGSGVAAAPLALAGAGVSAISNPGRVATYLGSLERLSAAQDTTISGAISAFLRRGSRAASAAEAAAARGVTRAVRVGLAGASAASVEQRFRERARQIDEAQQDPQRTIDRIAAQTRDLATAAPNVAASVGATVTRGQAYLAATRPQGRRLAGQLFAPSTEPQPSPEQQREWLRRVEAVDDPMVVLDALREGTIDRAQVDAIRNVYPQLYARIREEALRQIGDAAAPLSYQDRIRLGILLDAPTDPSLEPATLATLQQTYRTAGTTPQTPQNQPAPRVAQQLATGTDRIAARR